MNGAIRSHVIALSTVFMIDFRLLLAARNRINRTAFVSHLFRIGLRQFLTAAIHITVGRNR